MTTTPNARMPGTNSVMASTSLRPGTGSLLVVAPKMSSTPRGMAKVKKADSGLRQNDHWWSRTWCTQQLMGAHQPIPSALPTSSRYVSSRLGCTSAIRGSAPAWRASSAGVPHA